LKLELDENDVTKFVTLFSDIWDGSPLDGSYGYEDERYIIIANLVGQFKNGHSNERNTISAKPKRTSWYSLVEKAKEHQKDFLCDTEEGVPDCRNSYREIETWLQPPSWDFSWSMVADDDMVSEHLIDALFILLSDFTDLNKAKYRFDIYLSSMSNREYEQKILSDLLEVFFAFCQESNS